MENAAMQLFVLSLRVSGFRCSNGGQTRQMRFTFGGVVKLKLAPPSINKVVSSIHNHNGTSQKY